MATYNGGRYLEEQLRSIENQSHDDWVMSVSDDGSSDSTLSILRSFSNKYPGRVEVWSNTGPRGPVGNFAGLLRRAPASACLVLADQDDVWHPLKLQKLLAKLEVMSNVYGREAALLVFSDLRVVDAGRRVVAPSFFAQISARPERLSLGSTLVENSVPGCSMMINGAMLTLFQGYQGSLQGVRMHDWWLMLLGSSIGEASCVQEPLVDYRQHSSNAAGSVNRRGVRFVLGKVTAGRKEQWANVRQAQAFLEAYGDRLGDADRRRVEAFARLGSRSKMARVYLCLRFGLLKQGIFRRCYQLITV